MLQLTVEVRFCGVTVNDETLLAIAVVVDPTVRTKLLSLFEYEIVVVAPPLYWIAPLEDSDQQHVADGKAVRRQRCYGSAESQPLSIVQLPHSLRAQLAGRRKQQCVKLGD